MNNLFQLFQNQTFRDQANLLKDAILAVITNLVICSYKISYAVGQDFLVMIQQLVNQIKKSNIYNQIIQGNNSFKEKNLEQNEVEEEAPKEEEGGLETFEQDEVEERDTEENPQTFDHKEEYTSGQALNIIEKKEGLKPIEIDMKESIRENLEQEMERSVPILSAEDLPPSKLDKDLEEYLNINSCYAAAEQEDDSLYRTANVTVESIVEKNDLRECLKRYHEVVAERVTGEFIGDCLGILKNPPDLFDWTEAEWQKYGPDLEVEEIDLVGYDEEAYHDFRDSLQGTIKDLRQSLGLTDDNHPFDHTYILDCLRFIDPVFHQKYLIPYYNLDYNTK